MTGVKVSPEDILASIDREVANEVVKEIIDKCHTPLIGLSTTLLILNLIMLSGCQDPEDKEKLIKFYRELVKVGEALLASMHENDNLVSSKPITKNTRSGMN